MAKIVATELKFSQPVVVKQGDYLFTATNIELPTGKEIENVLEFSAEKLGLTVGAVGGTTAAAHEGAVGETATTTGLPAFAWCTPLLEAKTVNEKTSEVKEGYLAGVSVVSGKVILRVYSLPTAGDGKPIVEAKKATKIEFTAAQVVTIYAFGK